MGRRERGKRQEVGRGKAVLRERGVLQGRESIREANGGRTMSYERGAVKELGVVDESVRPQMGWDEYYASGSTVENVRKFEERLRALGWGKGQ